jgi:hypothetical protein
MWSLFFMFNFNFLVPTHGCSSFVSHIDTLDWELLVGMEVSFNKLMEGPQVSSIE